VCSIRNSGKQWAISIMYHYRGTYQDENGMVNYKVNFKIFKKWFYWFETYKWSFRQSKFTCKDSFGFTRLSYLSSSWFFPGGFCMCGCSLILHRRFWSKKQRHLNRPRRWQTVSKGFLFLLFYFKSFSLRLGSNLHWLSVTSTFSVQYDSKYRSLCRK